MVKSGLTNNPYVSPYRLTFHLVNALLIFSILIWFSMDYYYINSNKLESKQNLFQKMFLKLSIILTFITIISGGFMAGTDSGQSFNSYPLMNGKLFSN